VTFESFIIGFSLFCWFVLCGLLVFIWYWILFDDEPNSKKETVKQIHKPLESVLEPTVKLRFKKPSNL
jgi:hypothetical protein